MKMKRPRTTLPPGGFDDSNDNDLNIDDAENDDSSAFLTRKMACTATATATATTALPATTSSPSPAKNPQNQQLLEHEVCIQLVALAAAKQRNHEGGGGDNSPNRTSCNEKNAAELLSHYGDLLEHLLADPDIMETYFRWTKTTNQGSSSRNSSSSSSSSGSGFNSKNNETNYHFTEELVSKIRQTATEKGYTLDARISDTMLFNSIRRFYKTQLQCAEDRLTNVTQNHAQDDEIISILQRLEKQKFTSHDDDDDDGQEKGSVDDENNITPRANNKSTCGFCWEVNSNTTTTVAATTGVAPKTPQMDLDPSPSRKRCVVDMKGCPLPAKLTEAKTPTRSPEDARNIKRSKTSHNNKNNKNNSNGNNNNNIDENATTNSSSSSLDSAIDAHHQAKHQRRNESSSPSSFCNSNDDSLDKDTSWKARATLSREGSYEFQVSERLREIKLTEEIMDVDARDDDMARLLAFVRLRLAEGMYRSAIKFCHDTLQRLYQEAYSVAVSQPSGGRSNMLLKTYRETIAGVWCMYARFLHEIGDWDRNESSEAAAKGNQQFLSALHESATDDWRDYALATLASVTRCPLVGNHQDISMSMAQILVPAPGDGHDSSCHPCADDVSDALAACKDGIRRAQCVSEPQDYCPILLNEMDYHRMARYEIGLSAMKQDPVSVSELQASFEAVMKLPLWVEPTSEKYYLRDGRAGIPLVLAEMARLEKLLGNKSHQRLSPLDRKAPARSASSSSPAVLEDVMDTDSTASSSSTMSSTKSPRRQLFDGVSEKICTSCSRRLSVMEQELSSRICFECQKNPCNQVNLA